MRKKRHQSKFFLIALAIALILTFWGIFSYSSGSSSAAGNAVGIIVTPMRSLMHAAGGQISKISGYFENAAELKRQNEALREENRTLRLENEKSHLISIENEWLHSFLQLKRERVDFQFADARVIAKGAESFLTSFTLDKGTVHGIKTNMTVITSDKTLVGVITETGLTFSRGITILNYDGASGVYNERTGNSAVLSGDFTWMSEGKCVIKGLAQDTDILIGDRIYTSGLGEVLPKDLYVGEVVEIQPDPLTYTIFAVIEPAFDLISLDRVMIITDYQSGYE